MYRQILVQAPRSAFRSSGFARRTISSTIVRRAEGDTGAPRSGGSAQGDAFTKRENASEDYFVRQKEMEKLAQLKEKIAAHQKHLDELDKHVTDQMSSNSEEKPGKK